MSPKRVKSSVGTGFPKEVNARLKELTASEKPRVSQLLCLQTYIRRPSNGDAAHVKDMESFAVGREEVSEGEEDESI